MDPNKVNFTVIGKATILLLVFHCNFLIITNPYSIDFDVAMGSEDPYLRPFYKNLQSNLTKPISRWYRFIKPPIHPAISYARLKEVYNTNKLSLVRPNAQGIPRVIHQIWVGKNPFPEKYKAWQKTWQSLPGWTYKLWTDKEVEQFPLINQKTYNSEKNLGARADLLRLEILYREGGVYVDTDFECLKPEIFEALNNSYDFYCGLQLLDCEAFLINNAIIGSIPGHPILKACIDLLPFHFNSKWNLQIIFRGPGLFTSMVVEHMNKKHRDIVFPPGFFYPLGVDQLKQKPFSQLPFCEETLTLIKKIVLKPESLAIHWWDGSWGKPSAVLSNNNTAK